MSFLPGYFFYSLFLRDYLKEEDFIFPCSFGISLVIIGTIQFFSFLLGWSIFTVNLILYCAVTFGLYAALLLKNKSIRIKFGLSGILAVFILFNLYCLLLLALTPGYNAAYMTDWLLYFPNTLYYLKIAKGAYFTAGMGVEYLLKRTPLFSLDNSFFLSFYRHDYGNYQVISAFLNSLVFWNIYLIVKRLWGKRNAFLSLLLLAVCPILMQGACIPTPKMFSAFYLLSAFMFYLSARTAVSSEAKNTLLILFSVFAAAAFMVHPSSLIYLLCMLGMEILLEKGAFNWTLLSYLLLAGICLVLPWYIWAMLVFGINKVLVPAYALREIHLPVLTYLVSRLQMLLTTVFIPAPVIDALSARPGAFVENWGNPLIRFYSETFLGGFTVSGIIFAAWSLRNRDIAPGLKRLLAWTAAGALGSLLACFLVDLKGHAANMMTPLVIVVFCLLSGAVFELKNKFLVLLGFLASCEFILTRFLVYRVTLNAPKQPIALFERFYFLFDKLQGVPPSVNVLWYAALAAALAAYGFSVYMNTGRDEDR